MKMELEKIKVMRNRCRSLFNTFVYGLKNETEKRDTQARTVYLYARHKKKHSLEFHSISYGLRSRWKQLSYTHFSSFFHFHDETKHKINDWKRLKANHTVNCTYIWMSMISSESNRTELTVVAKERTYPGRMCDNFDRNSLAKIKIEPNRMERNGMEKNRFTMIAGDFIFVHLIENARSLCWLWFATHICLSSHLSIE